MLGQLRNDLGRPPVHEGPYRYLWIIDFPMFVGVDAVTGRPKPGHHPFTQPHPDDVHLLESDPMAVRSQAYDLVLNGWELGSGSIRIHQPELQAKIFELLGISEEEADRKFGFFLNPFRYGAPPHGGFAFGIDRLVAILAGEENIREVIAFPKTQSGTDLMTNAPTPVARSSSTSSASASCRRSTKPDLSRLRTVSGMLDLGLDPDVWPWIWLGASVVFALVELAFVGGSFIILPWAVSAFIASILAFYGVPVEVQWTVFVFGGAILFFILYRWAQRFMRDTPKPPGVGADRLVGMTGIVTIDISPDDEDRKGRVRIESEVWGALADGDGGIAAGQRVKVLAMKGTRVVVTPVVVEGNSSG